LGCCTLQLVYNTIAPPQPQNMLLPLTPWHNNLTMTSWFWWHFWPTHDASIDRAQPALSANAWQLARVGRNGRQKTFTQAAMQGRWAPPLSFVQNINNYFINFVRGSILLIKYIRSGLPSILEAVITVLGSWRSASTQQHGITNYVIPPPLSPTTCKCGALASLCHSPMFVPLLHSLLPSTGPFLVCCCAIIFDQRLPKATMYFLLFIFLLSHLPPQTIGRCPPCASPPPPTSAITSPHHFCQLWVDCWVS
jgi:hypothetical protein